MLLICFVGNESEPEASTKEGGNGSSIGTACSGRGKRNGSKMGAPSESPEFSVSSDKTETAEIVATEEAGSKGLAFRRWFSLEDGRICDLVNYCRVMQGGVS